MRFPGRERKCVWGNLAHDKDTEETGRAVHDGM